jgi:Dpy-30 motif
VRFFISHFSSFARHDSHQCDSIVSITYLYPSIGMSELVKERPVNPIEFLAHYLLKNDPQRVAGGPMVVPSNMNNPQQQQQQGLPPGGMPGGVGPR